VFIIIEALKAASFSAQSGFGFSSRARSELIWQAAGMPNPEESQ
jgi:hypothetical protein